MFSRKQLYIYVYKIALLNYHIIPDVCLNEHFKITFSQIVTILLLKWRAFRARGDVERIIAVGWPMALQGYAT